MRKISTFQISDLLPIGMTIVVLGIALAYGLQVMSETRNDIADAACDDNTNGFTIFDSASSTALCYNSTGGSAAITTADYNASVDAMSGVAKIPEKLPTIVTVIVAAVVIGILVVYLAGRFMGK